MLQVISSKHVVKSNAMYTIDTERCTGIFMGKNPAGN